MHYNYFFDRNYFNPGLTLNQNQEKFLKPMEGFLCGNLEKGKYVPYMEYDFLIKMVPKEDNEMLEIMSLGFAITELNLYLDVNPDDLEAFNKLKEYIKEYEKNIEEYVLKNKPLTITDLAVKQNFNSYLNSWPWEVKYR